MVHADPEGLLMGCHVNWSWKSMTGGSTNETLTLPKHGMVSRNGRMIILTVPLISIWLIFTCTGRKFVISGKGGNGTRCSDRRNWAERGKKDEREGGDEDAFREREAQKTPRSPVLSATLTRQPGSASQQSPCSASGGRWPLCSLHSSSCIPHCDGIGRTREGRAAACRARCSNFG